MKNISENSPKSSIREISQSELEHVNGGFLGHIIAIAVLILVPSVIHHDRNPNDNDPNRR